LTRKLLTAFLVALVIPIAVIHSASAYKQSLKASSTSWQRISAGAQVWVLGSRVSSYECAKTPTNATLSIQSSDGWVDVARAIVSIDPILCSTTAAAPYVLKYQFVLKIEGQKDFPIPGTHAKLLVFQITNDNGTSRRAIAAVYSDTSDWSGDEVDGKLPGTTSSDETDQQVLTLASTNQTPRLIRPKASVLAKRSQPKASPGIVRGWEGCAFNGVPMYGRVKVVSARAQFQVRLVKSNASLKVKGVYAQPKACGEWQFVSTGALFSVQVVRSGEDFTVSFGDLQSGVKKSARTTR
jgi:hypothetical protein